MTQKNSNIAERIWQHDASLWSDDEAVHEKIVDRLGWLNVADWIAPKLAGLLSWVDALRGEGWLRRVVVLGMGGSSLAPEVFSRIFHGHPEYPELRVLDSTSPEMVQEVLEQGLKDTLFIVASKTGTTLETTDLYRFFFEQVSRVSPAPGQHFVAITDGGSWLEQEARDNRFREVFINPSDIGGRYSALSYFGLVPAALYGVDLEEVVSRASRFAAGCRIGDEPKNPSLALGEFMGRQARQGRDKMFLRLPTVHSSLGVWIEQLVAESTGKQGYGILPVCETTEDPDNAFAPGEDCFVVTMSADTEGDTQAEHQFYLQFDDPLDIGAEFFRWEFATAVAAARLEVNPFDEPNVAEAKSSTNRFIENRLTLEQFVVLQTEQVDVSAVDRTIVMTDGVGFLPPPGNGNYLALLAYLPMNAALIARLETLRQHLAARYRVPCTLGFGPRYLHSTGQLHKGGPKTGMYLQFTSASDTDLEVPGRPYQFSELIAAQADGDMSVLAEKALPVMRLSLKGDRLDALDAVSRLLGARS